jgi:hypothetical protein
LSDLLGLAERSTHGDDRAMVFFTHAFYAAIPSRFFARRSASGVSSMPLFLGWFCCQGK